MTALIKHPNEAEKENQFVEPVIAKNATKDLKKIEELQQLKAEWQQALLLDEESESSDFSENLESNKEYTVEAETNSASASVKKNAIQTPKPVQKINRVESEMPPLATKKEIRLPVPMNSLRATVAEPIVVIESKKIRPTIRPAMPVQQKNSPKRQLYTIQVGAYKTKAYARKLERSLKRKGYDAFVSRNSKKIYRVQVDRFDSKEDAIKLAQRIQSKEKLKNFVTRLSGA